MVAMAMSGATAWAEVANALRITPRSGEPVTILFSQQPEVTFNASKLVIDLTDAPVSMDLADIEDMQFVYAQSSGKEITEIDTADITVRYNGNNIIFSNLPDGCDISVYGVDGRCRVQAKASGTWTLDGSTLGRGIYIIKLNNNVIKISIKQ